MLIFKRRKFKRSLDLKVMGYYRAQLQRQIKKFRIDSYMPEIEALFVVDRSFRKWCHFSHFVIAPSSFSSLGPPIIAASFTSPRALG